MDHLEIINRCRLGYFNSFEDLYKLYKDKALGMAYIIAGNKGIAEDIVQEAFIICFKTIRQLKNPSTFNVWFYRILVRVGWRIASKQKNSIPLSHIVENIDSCTVEAKTTEDSVEISDDHLLMREAIKKLKLPLRTALILYYYNEFSIKEIAKVTGSLEGTIKSRLHNARRLLYAELSPYFNDEPANIRAYGKEQVING